MSTAVQENVDCMRMLRGWHLLDACAQGAEGAPRSVADALVVIDAACGHEVAEKFRTYLANTRLPDGPPRPGEQGWGRFYAKQLTDLKRRYHPPLLPPHAPVLP